MPEIRKYWLCAIRIRNRKDGSEGNPVFGHLFASASEVVYRYSPLGRGILTGDAIAASSRPNGDYRAKDMRFSENHLSTTANLLQPLWNIARQREVSPVVVALAWILGRSSSAVVIPGAKSPNQIATCMLATSLLLTEAEHALLDAIRIPSPRTFEARPIETRPI